MQHSQIPNLVPNQVPNQVPIIIPENMIIPQSATEE